jgi:hypothetical protein
MPAANLWRTNQFPCGCSVTHNCQPSGIGPQDGSGCQPGGGVQFSGGIGQLGGGLNR